MQRSALRIILAMALAFGAGAAKAQDIAIAVVGPITGSNAALGEQMTRGAKMAVADINAKGGVLGKKLNLILADDACDPKQAVAAANDVVGKKVVFVAGHYCSSSSIPASAVYNEAGVLQMTPASTNPALTDDAAKKGGTTCSELVAATTCRAESPASTSPITSKERTWRSSTTRPPTGRGSPTRPRRR
mgnify:CR=1 FL=1